MVNVTMVNNAIFKINLLSIFLEAYVNKTKIIKYLTPDCNVIKREIPSNTSIRYSCLFITELLITVAINTTREIYFAVLVITKNTLGLDTSLLNNEMIKNIYAIVKLISDTVYLSFINI